MTERTIPAKAEGLSKKQEKIKAAFEAGTTLCALLNVCRAATYLAEEDDGSFVKALPGNLGKVLEHAEHLASNIVVNLERIGAA